MLLATLDKYLNITIYGIYAVTLILTVIFTVSMQLYSKIEDNVDIKIVKTPIYTPLEEEISILDDMMKKHHIVMGVILTVLCILDFNACPYIIRFLNFLFS